MVAPVVGRPLTKVVVSEAKRNWPFVVGFAITFTLVAKLSASLDRKEAHKSKFVNPYGHHCYRRLFEFYVQLTATKV